MPGILRTPRNVPAVNLHAVRSSQGYTPNDEVASILKGLKLDRSFFAERIRPEPLQELAPEVPSDALAKTLASEKSGRDAQRDSIRRTRRKLTFMQVVPPRSVDFDIYLNEAVMPVLAQALDALCRQVARMKEQGGGLYDPEVLARFNPLTWLGQQLLRMHPRCARTPRRAALYKNFRDWADWERGRREMLRRRYEVLRVFNGFMLRGVVSHETVPSVLVAVDDTMCLGGVLKDSAEVAAALQGDFSFTADPLLSNRKQTTGEGMYFEEFWYRLGTAIMRHDIVPYSVILRGDQRRQQVAAELEEWKAKQEAAEEERQADEAEKRRLTSEYAVLHEKLSANETIRSIIEDGKILTGDDVREGDVGYEHEAPPCGEHVELLATFLTLLGLVEEEAPLAHIEAPTPMAGRLGASMFRPSTKAHSHGKPAEGSDVRYWDDALSKGWGILQRVHHAELVDGVVDGETLRQVLVPPVGFNMLRAKVEYEVERRKEGGNHDADDEYDALKLHPMHTKPTKEQLCKQLGMTMPRLDWLHKLFESYLQPETDDPNAPPPCCLYPECPASLNKEQMRALIGEVEPNLSKAAFDARFARIDQDQSGLVEFDEFAIWVHTADVRVAGNSSAMKMTYAELAARYQEPVELIEYLHDMFRDQFPEDVEDGYPEEPVGLAKKEALHLASIIIPSLNRREFEEQFDFIDGFSRQRGHCDFDEFIELLDLEELPHELRDKFEEN